MKAKVESHQKCPVVTAIDIVGGKWKIITLNYLISGTMRFKELEKAIGIVSPKMLTKVLEDLEHEGLINRVVAMQKPLKVEYSLTERGKFIKPVIESLEKLGEKLMKSQN